MSEREPPTVIRVLIVDDDPTCREGLRQLLSLDADLEVVGEARDAEEAFRVGFAVKPDVVVIDADLPRASCMEAMGRLAGSAADGERPTFICLAVYPDQHDAALQAGAVRFLRKDGSRRELVEAIREAAQGGPADRWRFPCQPPDPACCDGAQGS